MRQLLVSVLTLTFVLIFAGNSIAVPSPPVVSLATQGLSVTVVWTPSQGASGYRLAYAPYPWQPWMTMDDIHYADMGARTDISFYLWEGAAYYVAVLAYDDQGNSDFSNVEYFIMGPPSPEWVDNDGDGLSERQGDCDDTNVYIYPGAVDACGDGYDADCDGSESACSMLHDLVVSVQNIRDYNNSDFIDYMNYDISPMKSSNYKSIELDHLRLYSNGTWVCDNINLYDSISGVVSGVFFSDVTEYNSRISGSYMLENNIYMLNGQGVAVNAKNNNEINVEIRCTLDVNGTSVTDLKCSVDDTTNNRAIISVDTKNNIGDTYTRKFVNNCIAPLNPVPVDICGDSLDQDCSGTDLSCLDVDNDGDGSTENNGDCNDGNKEINPSATEICDNDIDENCDNDIDENCNNDIDENCNNVECHLPQLVIGSVNNLNISLDADESYVARDYYEFTVPKSGLYNISTNNNNIDWMIGRGVIYSFDNDISGISSIFCFDFSNSCTLSEGEIYYIETTSYSPPASYTLTIQ